MKSYREISEEYNNFVKGNGGYWSLTEYDQTNNRYNRAMIRALKRENKHIYLGDRNGAVWEYTGGMVYNFSCDFITLDVQAVKNAEKGAFESLEKIFLVWV